MSGGRGGPGTVLGARTRLAAIRQRLGPVLRAHFGIDARALAAFRIALGVVLLLNLVLRTRYLSEFYTDQGVLTRATMAELYPVAERLSLHGQFGSVEAQAVLFLVGAIAAISLLVGYRTTTATIVSFVLLVSLHGRNPLVLNGGDILLRHLLLWAIFLPLSERWAVDARRRSRRPRAQLASIATAGLLLQVLAVYAVNAVLKHRSVVWRNGTAMEYIFGLDQFTVVLGDYLAESTILLSVFGRLWFWMLSLSWLLLVLQGWPRAGVAGMFVAAHLSMGLTMELGLFPLVSVAGLLPFFPARFWDVIERRFTPPIRRTIERAPRVARRWSGYEVTKPQWAGRGVALWRTYVVPAIALVVLVVLFVNNVGSVTHEDMGPLADTDLTDSDPRWNMFAPRPPKVASWHVMAGTLASGERVDAYHGGALSWDRPPDLSSTNPTARWRKYFSHVRSHDVEAVREDLASHLCRQWNARHDGRLESVTMTHMRERILLDGQNEVDRREIGTYDCVAVGRHDLVP